MPDRDPPLIPESDVPPDTSLLITEDGNPVDNVFVEKQYRLLTEPLWTSWKNPTGKPFRVLANVGLFFEFKEPPLVPDTMVALDVATPQDPREYNNRSYFMWLVGKPPDIVIEIVSDRRGREDTEKLLAYQKVGVPFYAIFDPDAVLDGHTLRAFALLNGEYAPIDPTRLGNTGLGLILWEGEFEDTQETWLRWIDRDGVLVPYSLERAELEMKRTEAEKRRAESERRRADTTRRHAQYESKRANEAEEKAIVEAQRAKAEAERANAEAERADAAEAAAAVVAKQAEEHRERALSHEQRIRELEDRLKKAGGVASEHDA